MLQYLPKWILRRGKVLWEKFGDRKFTFDQAKDILEDDDSRMVAVVLSELKRSGWLNISSKPDNARIKMYSFSHPETMKEVMKIQVGD